MSKICPENLDFIFEIGGRRKFNLDRVHPHKSRRTMATIKYKNGNHVGKYIIFVQNKRHTKFIVERFDKYYITV